eukprot:1138468-Prymnesium_polylepis.1
MSLIPRRPASNARRRVAVDIANLIELGARYRAWSCFRACAPCTHVIAGFPLLLARVCPRTVRMFVDRTVRGSGPRGSRWLACVLDRPYVVCVCVSRA